MRIKKFDCHNCGAPKVTPYTNPYIVCDYCGYMIDVDYAVGLQVWNHSLDVTNKYMEVKAKFTEDSARYLAEKNKEAYGKVNHDFWDYYYTNFPEYLPPTIPKGEKYNLYIQYAADVAVDSMDAFSTVKSDAYTAAYAEVAYYEKDGKQYVTYDSFMRLIQTYMDLQEQGLRFVYDNPKYHIMNEVLPEKFVLKMKLSQLAQVWVPYLEDENANAFLNQYQLNQEYVEMEDPILKQYDCEDCKKELTIPAGAIRCICQYCRHMNILKKAVHCHDCGYENELPPNWSNMITCKSCGTQLRVVQPLFS